jgi:DNA-binding SARP family transcriptional activator
MHQIRGWSSDDTVASIRRAAADAALRDWLQAHVGLRIAEMTSPSKQAGSVARVQLLGAPQLHARDGRARALERREAALLALLAIEGPMPRARAAALLWSDADSEHARSSLRQRLFKLRRSAGIDVVVPDDVLRLADGVAHDLVPIAPRLAEDPAAGAAELLGELDYSDCPGLDEWVAVAREQWRSRRIQALAEIAARLEAEQKIAAALPYAERLVADDPTLEHGHRRLMRLHYLRGDRAAALSVYARCRELLRLHAGAAPGRETVELARLIEQSGELPAHAARPAPLSLLKPPRLVGREAEWRAIDEAMARSGVALLVGEPGIGKSRLMSDWLAPASSLASGARASDTLTPHSFSTRWLRALMDRWSLAPLLTPHVRAELARLLPELGACADGPWQPERMRHAATAAVAAGVRAGCGVIALDDLHHADEASLALLLHLWRREPTGPSWLLAARGHEVPPLVRAWIDEAAPQSLTVIDVRPLDEVAVRDLLASLGIESLDAGAWAAPMHRHTGGNPLFILETLRAMWLGGGWSGADAQPALPSPLPIAQMIERRVAQLPEAARELARVAAIAGQDFDAELAAKVLARAPLALVDAWRALEAAQILREGAFAHDLMHDAMLRSIPADLARLLHREVARFLEAGARSPARVAYHWEAAGDAERAGRSYEEAARGAAALNALGDSADLLRRAGDSFEQAGLASQAFASRVQQSHWLDALKRFAEQGPLVEQLRASASTPRERMLALMREGIHLQGDRADERALATLEQARVLALGLGDEGREAAAEITWRLAYTRALHGQVEQSLAIAKDFMADLDGHPQEMLWRREYANLLEFAARYEEALAQIERAVALARAAGERRRLSECLITRSVVQGDLGHLHATWRDCEQARALLLAVDGSDQPTIHDRQLAAHRREAGRFAEALALIVPALEWFRANDNAFWTQMCQLELARLYVTLGQPARAQQLMADFEPASTSSRISLLMGRARIAKTLGQASRAFVEEAAALTPQTERPMVLGWIVAIELVSHQEPPAALQLIESALADATNRHSRGWARALRLRRIESLVRAGRAGDAVRDAAPLMREIREHGEFWLYAPEYWWGFHRAFEAAGDAPAAREALTLGRDWILKTALPNVPADFRDSFLHRNPLNRDLLAAAHRLLG